MIVVIILLIICTTRRRPGELIVVRQWYKERFFSLYRPDLVGSIAEKKNPIVSVPIRKS